MIKLKSKVQTIYYQTNDNDLEMLPLTYENNKKMTITQAKSFLDEQGIDFNRVLKVTIDDVYVTLNDEQFKTLVTIA